MSTKEEGLRRRGWTEQQVVDGMTPCWNWNGTVMENGYGYVHAENRLHRAHRVSYEVFVEAIPGGLVVRHLCNNRRCIRPDHLTTGTQRQNLNDMVGARRSANGERNARAVLTDDEVTEIRAAYAGGATTYRALGERYGVDESTIGVIVRGKKRQHPTYRKEQTS